MQGDTSHDLNIFRSASLLGKGGEGRFHSLTTSEKTLLVGDHHRKYFQMRSRREMLLSGNSSSEALLSDGNLPGEVLAAETHQKRHFRRQLY